MPVTSPLIRANAVGYLRNYPDARAGSALLAAATTAHPAIRAVAISSLGQRATAAPAEDDAARRAVLAALDDPQRAVRIAALVSLINLRGQPLAAPDLERFQRVGREFARMERLYRDDAGFERDLGVVHLLGGELDRAAESLQVALTLDPAQPTAKFLLAVARINQRRFDDARAAAPAGAHIRSLFPRRPGSSEVACRTAPVAEVPSGNIPASAGESYICASDRVSVSGRQLRAIRFVVSKPRTPFSECGKAAFAPFLLQPDTSRLLPVARQREPSTVVMRFEEAV